jgi:hypothetical protein
VALGITAASSVTSCWLMKAGLLVPPMRTVRAVIVETVQSTPITIICTVPSLVVADGADLRRTHLSWGDATLLSSHAGDPRRRRATRQKPVRPKGRQANRESARRRPRAKPTSRTTPAAERQVLTEAMSRSTPLCLRRPASPTAQASLRPSGRCRIVRRAAASPRVPPRRRSRSGERPAHVDAGARIRRGCASRVHEFSWL